MGAEARTEFPVQAMADGDVLEMGRVRLSVLATPGHTPEGISILVYDLDQSEQQPHAVLTGDTLFIGDVGRPDLMASEGMTADALARMLYRSLRDKLLPLPDETLVYPAHGAGSMCGKNLSTDTVSTIGAQRRSNAALQPMSEDEFVGLVTGDQPVPPAYFAYDAQRNRQEHPTLDDSMRRGLQPLSLEQVLELRAAGAQVLDVRAADAWAGGHLAGSLNIGLGGKYATWAGSLVDREQPIVLVAEPGREAEAALRLGRIGFDHLASNASARCRAAASRLPCPAACAWAATSRKSPQALALRPSFSQQCARLNWVPMPWSSRRLSSSLGQASS
jgi:rhodanese-related sulfurtransferase